MTYLDLLANSSIYRNRLGGQNWRHIQWISLDMFGICLDTNLGWKRNFVTKISDSASFSDLSVAIHLE